MIRMGNKAEIEGQLEQLQQTNTEALGEQAAIIEILAYANQPQAILDFFSQLPEDRQNDFNPMVQHFVAVAYALTGDEETAQAIWEQQIEETSYDLPVIQQSLADLNLDAGDGNGAWFLDTFQLMPVVWNERIERALGRGDDDESVKRDVKKLFETTPGLACAVTMILEQGSGFARGSGFAADTLFCG